MKERSSICFSIRPFCKCHKLLRMINSKKSRRKCSRIFRVFMIERITAPHMDRLKTVNLWSSFTLSSRAMKRRLTCYYKRIQSYTLLSLDSSRRWNSIIRMIKTGQTLKPSLWLTSGGSWSSGTFQNIWSRAVYYMNWESLLWTCQMVLRFQAPQRSLTRSTIK